MRKLLVSFGKDLDSFAGAILGREPLKARAVAAYGLLYLVLLVLYDVVSGLVAK